MISTDDDPLLPFAMRLILTHNNADFDAVASLLAMHRLDPTATPVLPQRLHRNVQNFLTLYAGLLAALSLEDIAQAEGIEFAYLVDSQKYQALPQVASGIPVHIIDHHPVQDELPKHYTFSGEPVGATTTLLVEQLQQEDILVNPLEATLLLLGIYEDTGTLTYGATTPRDAYAAGWLLERGADLSVVSDFLSHSLEDRQWTVYEKLRESATVYEIEGHSILLATTVCEAHVEGIAAVAHQLANLYEPSALIILVQMGENTQLVARSSADEIDVGEIARHFGGGGHRRAAAGLIYHQPLARVSEQLLELLPEVVQPSITVAELMSSGPIETISADATVSEAAQQMQVSGHEGYPVMADNRVVGLLTRRAVDRAMSHHLGHQRVAQVMEDGYQVHVKPSDSLEMLRQKMMNLGWGQMPVLDEHEKLIGIVTRTDLIRRWESGPRNYRQRQDILQRLQKMLPAGLWDLLAYIAQESQQRRLDLYLVGGLVRDLLLEVPNLDIDFVVEGDAIALVQSLHEKYGGDIRYHLQFGTAKWLLDKRLAQRLGITFHDDWPEFIDFATARAEFYKAPTVLPTVRQSSIKQDLHRRDFTINSMALRFSPEPMGELIDYYNGERDLNQKQIRVLHSLSFVDDPTRMIRAVRFEQRLGFRIEPRTLNLLDDALPFLDRVTGERIRNEMRLILRERSPFSAFQRLQELGILEQILPQLTVDRWFEGALGAYQYARETPPWPLESVDHWYLGLFGLLTARLSPDELQAVGNRLSISRAQMKLLRSIRDGYAFLVSIDPVALPSSIVKELEVMDPVCWVALWAAAPTAQLRRLVFSFVTEWRHIRPSYDGNQLQALGVNPGPQMGHILDTLRDAWIDGAISTREAERRLLQQLIEQQ